MGRRRRGKGGQGSSTANFLSSMAGSLPPMLHMMRDIGGVEMPEFFGKLVDEAVAKKMAGEADAAVAEAKPAPKGGGAKKS